MKIHILMWKPGVQLGLWPAPAVWKPPPRSVAKVAEAYLSKLWIGQFEWIDSKGFKFWTRLVETSWNPWAFSKFERLPKNDLLVEAAKPGSNGSDLSHTHSITPHHLRQLSQNAPIKTRKLIPLIFKTSVRKIRKMWEVHMHVLSCTVPTFSWGSWNWGPNCIIQSW